MGPPKKVITAGVISWWAHQDLNLGPFGYEPTALTAELWAPHTTKMNCILRVKQI